VAVACAAVFGQSLGHRFLFWDDWAFITGNRLIAHPSLPSLSALWTRPLLSLWVPLTYTLWWLVSAIAGVHAWAFHLTNVVLHGLAIWAMFRLLADAVAPHAVGAALAGALVFGLHPLQAEPVAWVSTTKDVLAGLCGLVAMRRFLAWRAHGRVAAYVGATLAFVAALLAKPSAVVVPALLVVLGRLVERRDWRASVRGLAPWFAIAAAWTILAMRVQPAAERLRYTAPIPLRPVLALDTLSFYLGKLVFPVGLAPDYGRTSERLLASGAWHYTWIPAAMVLVATYLVRRRVPSIAAGVALFTTALLPVLGLVPFDFQSYSNVADHYAYLALLGPATAVALAYPALPRIAIPAAVAVLGLLAFIQTARWRDDATLAVQTLTVNPRSVMAHNTSGQLLEERGRLDDALAEYRRALDVDPQDEGALNNVGNVLFKLDRYDDAIRHYTAIFAQGEHPSEVGARMHNNLGAAYLKTKRYDDAVSEFRRALAIDPTYVEPYYNLGIVLLAFGRRVEAADVFRQGLAQAPDHPALRAQLAAAESGAGP
jgi:tetratricopeptide (TPR) repeat protein